MGYERYAPPVMPRWRERLSLYWALVRGDRPVGWLLLLWPTWWGLWLAAEGVPPLWPLVVFTAVAAMFAARNTKTGMCRGDQTTKDRPNRRSSPAITPASAYARPWLKSVFATVKGTSSE